MDNEIVKLTKLWIERFVIGLRLCPFAHYSFYDETIYYVIAQNNDSKSCLKDIIDLFTKMKTSTESEISNSFLIFDKSLTFDQMLTLKEESDLILEEDEFDGQFQTVIFHPGFQFAGENFHAAGNFINRSPLPMLHILRVEEVAHAIKSTSNVEEIPFQNKKLLEDINVKSISEVFEENFIDRIKPYI
jgi:hypothetical protein